MHFTTILLAAFLPFTFAVISIAIPAVTVTSASLSTTLAALGITKLGAAGLLAIKQRRRGKRQTGEGEDEKLVGTVEESQCLKRLLCNADTKGNFKGLNLNLSSRKLKIPYNQLVKVGFGLRGSDKCKTAYPCPVGTLLKLKLA